MNRRNLANKISIVILVIILLTMPIVIKGAYIIHIMIMAGISVILCTSLRLILMAGIYNLGHIAFYAIGAYLYTLLSMFFHLSFWLLLPLTGIIPAAISVGFGYLTIRVRGIYFLMMTLAFVEIVRLTLMAVPFLGTRRVVSIPPPNPIVIPNLLTIEFNSKVPYYYLILVLIGITIAVLYFIEKSRFGDNLKSIAVSEPLCESLGINTTRNKVFAFAIGSFFAGITGCFFAGYVGIISPGTFSVWASVMLMLAVILGGAGSIWGPMIGATFMTILPEALRGAAIYEPMISATILILIIYFLRGGLITLPEVVRAKITR